MRLIARGYQYKEVAKELFISIKTVETHVSLGAAQAPAVLPPRAHRLGHRPPPALTRRAAERAAPASVCHLLGVRGPVRRPFAEPEHE